jgi:hypothetical protein
MKTSDLSIFASCSIFGSRCIKETDRRFFHTSISGLKTKLEMSDVIKK